MPLMEIFDINSAVETLKLLETDKRERATKKKKKKQEQKLCKLCILYGSES